MVFRRVRRTADQLVELSHVAQYIVGIVFRPHSVSHRNEAAIVVLARIRSVRPGDCGSCRHARQTNVVAHLIEPIQAVIAIVR